MCGRGRVLAEPRLSPDGQLVAFVATSGGRAAIVVVPVEGGPEVVVTSDPPPPPTASYGGGTFDWTPTSDALVYVGADRLLYHQPVMGGPPRLVVGDGATAAPAVSPDGGHVAYVRDGRHVAVAVLGEGGAWPVRLSEAPDFAFDPVWSRDGSWVAWHEWNVPAMPWDDSRIVMAPSSGGGHPIPVLPAATSPVAVSQPRFSPDGTALAFLCDQGGWLNLWRADVDGGRPAPILVEEAEHGGPSWGPGQRSFAWCPDGRRVAFCRNEGGFGRLCVASADGPDGAVTVCELDRGVYTGLTWAGNRIVGLRSGARTPDQVVALDPEAAAAPAAGSPAAPTRATAAATASPAAPTRATAAATASPATASPAAASPAAASPAAASPAAASPGAPTRAAPAAGPPPATPASPPGPAHRRTLARGPVAGFEAAGLVEPEPVTWEGEMVPGVGTTVHGRLYRSDPAGPLLVWVHGGPTGQNQVTFNARAAFFCDRGANVLQVDHRGSTGWGRAYAQALRGEWGRLDVADTAAGMRAAARGGWGDERRMVPIGASAGGLTVLLLLATHPELCAAGVDLYGVTDLFDLDETTHRFEAHYLRSIVGELPAEASRYRARSPITVAARIAAPLLVLQGSADNVVPRAQSDSLVAAVRAGGGTVEYQVYEGEGHGWSRAEVVEDELDRTWAFLRRFVMRRR